MFSLPRTKSCSHVIVAAVLALTCGSLVAVPAQADDDAALPAAPVLPEVDTTAATTDQFIVKFKERAGISSADRGNSYGRAATEVGVPVKPVRETSTGSHVVATDRALGAEEAERLVESLKSDPNVEFAEPDFRMYPAASPNDEFYPLQWNLFEEAGGIRLPEAWSVNQVQCL